MNHLKWFDISHFTNIEARCDLKFFHIRSHWDIRTKKRKVSNLDWWDEDFPKKMENKKWFQITILSFEMNQNWNNFKQDRRSVQIYIITQLYMSIESVEFINSKLKCYFFYLKLWIWRSPPPVLNVMAKRKWSNLIDYQL